MSAVTAPGPVCVTGATGFVAAHVVKRLLEGGYRVRGTVRDPGRADHLTALPGSDRLELVAADLLDEGAFDAAVAGCAGVLHTASPYVVDVADPQRDLVDPAVKGTRNVLAACARAGVARVVVTSSMAAVTDEPDGRVLTEDDWNTTSSLRRNPYYFSKTLAEREAWRIAEERGLDLVVVNPFLVVGPSLSRSLNASNRILADLVKGGFPGIVRLTWGMVDVRDVAEAHVRVLEAEDAEGRYLVVNANRAMREVVEVLKPEVERHKLPSLGLDHPVGDAVVRLASWFQPRGTGSYLRSHLGRVPRYDTSKIQALGLAYRDLDETLRETVRDLQRWGHLG